MKVSERDEGVRVAFGLLALGVALAAYGFSAYRQPMAMLPGLDGAMIVGPLTLGLALMHGLSYRNALSVLLPIVAVQVGVCFLHRAAWPAILGVEAIVVGLVGVALYAVSSVPAARASSAKPASRRPARAPTRSTGTLETSDVAA